MNLPSRDDHYERTQKMKRASVWGFVILGIGVLGAALMMKDGFPFWSYFPFFVGLGVCLILWMRHMWKLEEWCESPRIVETQDSLDTTSASASEEQEMPESVILWLDSATDGLGELAKGRIAVDIEAHYRDAYAAALEEGLSLSDADQRAIKVLGNPHHARKGFRQVYLTRREEARIRKAYTNVASNGRTMEQIFGFTGITLALIQTPLLLIGFVQGELEVEDWVSLPVMQAIMGIGLWLFFRWTRLGRLKRSHVVRLFMSGFIGILWAPLVIFEHLDEGSFYLAGMGALSLFCIFFLVFDARMLGKLPNELTAEERTFFGRKTE